MGVGLHGFNQTSSMLYWKPVYYSCHLLYNEIGWGESVMR
jgi:hypothetical protein